MQFAVKHLLSVLCFFIFFHIATCAETYHRVRIDLQGRGINELSALGVAMDLAEYRPGVFVTGEFSDTELRQISGAGFPYDVLISDMSRYYQRRNEGLDRDSINLMLGTRDNGTPYDTPENFSLGSMGGFHTYSEMLDDLDAMHAMFPHLISEREPIGELTTIEGRPVYWMRISNDPGTEQDKPRVLYTALTHAREPGSMQQMLFQMWYLLENYESDPEIRYIIDHAELYFVPCVNPDGYIYCETTHPNGGSMHRKNMRVNHDGSLGVDLNRNFGYKWGYDNTGSSPHPPAQTYRGTGPFSEPETQLQKQLTEAYGFSLALNNHTFSDLLLYPWGYSSELTPDGDIFIAYAQMMTRENNYVYGTCYETLGYFANGVSDDWFYGEQETKDKVFAFTPEAGSPSDGFWPAIDRIEEICAGHTHMNMGLALLALAYAELEDLTGPYIAGPNAAVDFEVFVMGQDLPATFTVSLHPLSDNITGVGEPVVFSGLDVLDREEGTIGLEFGPYVAVGDEIRYVLSLDNGQFAWNDTITKHYGQPELLLYEHGESLDNWTTDTWGLCDENYHSPPASIADSPGSNYQDDSHTHITIAEPLDFGRVSQAWCSFMTRYVVELGWDYVQFLYSVDGKETWVPLEGNYTETGNNNQDPGQPLYQGVQREWVEEEVDLSHLAGEEEVWLRFRLVSDHTINYEGFFFDDFALYVLQEDEVLAGDANCDGIIDVQDVIAIVNYYIGNPPDPFCAPNADVNKDGIINVLDVVEVISIFMGDAR